MCAHMQDSGHTPEWAGPMVERTMRNGKRIYTSAFKAWLVEQSRVPGVSVSGLAVRHGVNANLLRHWMRLEHWGAPAPDLPHRGAECTKAHTRGLPPRRQGGLRQAFTCRGLVGMQRPSGRMDGFQEHQANKQDWRRPCRLALVAGLLGRLVLVDDLVERLREPNSSRCTFSIPTQCVASKPTHKSRLSLMRRGKSLDRPDAMR